MVKSGWSFRGCTGSGCLVVDRFSALLTARTGDHEEVTSLGKRNCQLVQIFHHELSAPEQAVAGPEFIPVLAGDLVEPQRKILVRVDSSRHEGRDSLLVG